LLVDREVTHRRDKRLAARLRYVRLRHHAVVEDVDYRAPRGLDRALFHKLAGGEWIDVHDNLIPCGPTGVGKSWLACALGHKACRDNRSVLSITGSLSSLLISPWPAATAAMLASCAVSTVPNS
jgi:DNA replication protein DnaC